MRFKLFNFGTAEKKLLIVFCYFILMTVITIASSTLLVKKNSELLGSIQKYFTCEQGGHNPNNPCSRSDIDNMLYPLDTLGFMMFSLFPVITLLYVINIQELKEFWRKCFEKHN